MTSVVSMTTQLPLLGDIRRLWLDGAFQICERIHACEEFIIASGHMMQSCGLSDLNDTTCSSKLDLLCRQRFTNPEKPLLQKS